MELSKSFIILEKEQSLATLHKSLEKENKQSILEKKA